MEPILSHAGETRQRTNRKKVNIWPGARFGRLTVINECLEGYTCKSRPGPTPLYFCQCECGEAAILMKSNLLSSTSTSCGCYKRVCRVTHGKSGSLTYDIWSAMKARCLSPKNRSYQYYGARGISVCERWLVFENFIDDMGEAGFGMSIERRDNDKGYSPDNCYWLPKAKQVRNRNVSKWITYEGETLLQSEWARRIGIDVNALKRRLRKWPLELAMTTPALKRGQRI